jgi:hypothetical protein
VLLSTTTSRELTDPCALVPLAPWYCLAFGSVSGMPPSLTLHLPLLLACDTATVQQQGRRRQCDDGGAAAASVVFQ